MATRPARPDFTILLLSVLLLSSPVMAADAPLLGTWKLTESRATHTLKITKVDGDRVEGTFEAAHFGKGPGQPPVQIHDATLKDGLLVFSCDVSRQKVKFTGKLDGKTLNGTYVSESRPEKAVKWEAKLDESAH